MKRLILLVLTLLVFIACEDDVQRDYVPQPESPLVFLPIIAVAPAGCTHYGEGANRFAERLKGDLRQLRKVLECDPRLVDAARRRAEAALKVPRVSHYDLEGRGPNYYAESSGCTLPAQYTVNGNNIESLILGTPNGDAAFEALAASPKHSTHLFGLTSFFSEQDKFGIAVWQDKSNEYEWSLIVLISQCTEKQHGLDNSTYLK